MSFWVAGAIVGAGLLGAGASKSAANTQAGAQIQAANTQQNMFNTINAQEQPFMQAGYGATGTLAQLLGTAPGTPSSGGANGSLTQPFNPTQAQLENYPGYKFALETGGQAVRNASTPGVGALSGPALKDLMTFNTGLASQNYQNYFNNTQTQQTNIFNRLNAIAGLGQNAASNVGNAGTSLGTGIAGAQAAAGGSQAAGTVGAANALTGGAVPLAYLLSGQNSTTGVSQQPGVTGWNSAEGGTGYTGNAVQGYTGS